MLEAIAICTSAKHVSAYRYCVNAETAARAGDIRCRSHPTYIGRVHVLSKFLLFPMYTCCNNRFGRRDLFKFPFFLLQTLSFSMFRICTRHDVCSGIYNQLQE